MEKDIEWFNICESNGTCDDCIAISNALEYSSVDVYCSELIHTDNQDGWLTNWDKDWVDDGEIDIWEIDDDGIPF